MKLVGLIRLGRDAEIRYTGSGTPVATLSGAWNYGQKDGEGKRPTQWADLSLWGERAEKLTEYLLKGKQLFVVADDVHIQTFERNNGGGTGFKLVGRVDSIEFAGGQSDQGGQQQGQQRQQAPAARQAAPTQQRQAPPKTSTGFDDMDDDIPF